MRIILCLLLSLMARPTHARDITVFAAASLTEALKDVSAAWTNAGHPPLRLSFGSSSALARQIEQRAPAAVFASADEKWMDYLAERDLIARETRRDLLGNELVLIVPASAARTIAIGPISALTDILGPHGRLAVGDPSHVPAGIYAAQSLRSLGLWDAAVTRLARMEDVRGALLLVERGEAPAGIVYATDAAASNAVAIAGRFPGNSHDPIAYPFAVTKAGDTPEARAFMDFLSGGVAKAIFARRGFKVE